MRFFGPVRFLPFALFLLFTTTLTSAILAQEPGWPLDGPAFSASPSEILSAATKVDKEKFADVTVLFEEARYVLDGAGRLKQTHRLVYRLETPAGVQSWSTAAVRWESWYQNEPQIHARVLQNDGRATELDQKTLTDVPAENEGGGTFEDARIHKAPLPALAVGAIVEQETVLVDKEPFFNGGGVYRNYFYRNVPIARSRLVVEAPVEVPLQYRVKDMPELVVKKEEKDGVQRLTFDQSHLKARGNSDIQLATHDPRYPNVEFSTGKSWKSVVTAYAALAEPQMVQSQVKGEGATAGGGSRDEMIQAMVSELHREVRYTGIEFGRSKLTPQTPAEVLNRHYGDCKDKAALLVTMLRAKGIAANLALLNAGPGGDVTPELPGMNQFDHAIVYVPADAKGNRALWIDATAEYTRVGDLPYGDSDRLALIVAEDTSELTRTPLPTAENNVVVEKREFTLKEFGPASAVEVSETRGEAEAEYRSWYGGVESKESKSNMERYAKTAYLAKDLTKIEHSDQKDFSKPFTLRLEIAEAKRGSTDLVEAAVAVSPVGVLNRLPKWFATDPKQGQEKETADQKEEREKAEALRSGEYDVEPQITEWRYEIVPATGFALRALPEDKIVTMGPATLTQRYSMDKAGVFSAVIRFETTKPRYTTEEALALRKGVLEANQSNFVMVMFDQTGAKLLADGKMREALDADRALMQKHPNEALHHSALAIALLKAGVGDKAREEARKATELEPKSALAYATLAWVLQHNSIGVRFGKGFDLAGGVAAYQKAVELDPDNLDYRANLAILEEFDASGDRYATGANLPEAIRVYRALQKQDEAVGKQYEDNVLYAMLYSRQYKEVLDEIATLPSSAVRDGIAITALAAKEGAPAGVKRADQISGGAQDRATALSNAGGQLIQLRLYPQAAEILTAGLQGQENAAQTARQIEMFRTLKPAGEDGSLPATDPREPVQRMIRAMMTGTLNEATISELLAHHAYADEAVWKKNAKKNEAASGVMRVAAASSGSPVTVLEDVMVGSLKLTQEGDAAKGYRISAQMMGAPAQHFFVVKEDGRYRIVASGNDMEEVATEAIYLLHSGHEEEARSLLDWKRDEVHKGGGDDPLEGMMLPRFWTSGETKGADAIEVASASLLTGKPQIKDLLPKVERARAAATTDQARGDLDQLLALAYLREGDAVQGKAASERLLKAYPDSITAVKVAGQAYGQNKDWASWTAMLDARQAKHPSDADVARERSEEARTRGDFAGARKALQPLMDSGKAETNDYNLYGWLQLFDGTVNADGVQAVQQASMLAKNQSAAVIHTLACMYAAEGKTTEARQLLLQAMAASQLAEPDSSIWYGFGSIYEQYGVKDAAIAAYSKVEKPEGRMDPVDTYVLAEARLKALQGQ